MTRRAHDTRTRTHSCLPARIGAAASTTEPPNHDDNDPRRRHRRRHGRQLDMGQVHTLVNMSLCHTHTVSVRAATATMAMPGHLRSTRIRRPYYSEYLPAHWVDRAAYKRREIQLDAQLTHSVRKCQERPRARAFGLFLRGVFV